MMRYNKIEEIIQDLKENKMIMIVDDDESEDMGVLASTASGINEALINEMIEIAHDEIMFAAEPETYIRLNIPAAFERHIITNKVEQVITIDYVNQVKPKSKQLATIVKHLISLDSNGDDFIRPGILTVIRTRLGGVLKRAGHPEAIVDLAKLANSYPAGVFVRLVDKEGIPLTRHELEEIAVKYNLKVISIASIIAHRKQTENLIVRAAEAKLPTLHGEFRMIGFENVTNGEHHVALVKGEINPEDEVLVRVHSECLTGDAFGSMKCDCGDQLHAALDKIEKAGKGILLYMRQEGRGIGLINKIKAYALQDQGMDTVDANLALGFDEDLRDYGIGAQILSDLGVKKVRLMTNNPLKLKGLSGHGIEIIERVPIQLNHNEKNLYYMKTKKDRMGHILKFKE
ncbi:MAG TPA: GTP cyclohydrolase II [Acholeplasmataceae bacterium]|nr:GTP cyclohydrolase II [Acholeplasmataceae bacterium]